MRLGQWDDDQSTYSIRRLLRMSKHFCSLHYDVELDAM